MKRDAAGTSHTAGTKSLRLNRSANRGGQTGRIELSRSQSGIAKGAYRTLIESSCAHVRTEMQVRRHSFSYTPWRGGLLVYTVCDAEMAVTSRKASFDSACHASSNAGVRH